MKIKIQIIESENRSYLIAESIYGYDTILQQVNSVNHYEIIKLFFPAFNEEYQYNLFEVFPYFNSDIKINRYWK